MACKALDAAARRGRHAALGIFIQLTTSMLQVQTKVSIIAQTSLQMQHPGSTSWQQSDA